MGGEVVLKLDLMLLLVSNLCDIQSQVTMTARHECCPGFPPKFIASWLTESHASPCRVSRNDKRKELSFTNNSTMKILTFKNLDTSDTVLPGLRDLF